MRITMSMEWTEDALILGTRKHGESGAIVEVMTRARGRHLGLVRGGRSRKMQPTLQAGNQVRVTWRARLEDHLGNFTVEPIILRAAQLMETRLGLNGIQTIAALLRLLPERDPHPGLADAAELIIDNLEHPEIAGALTARFELAILDELGFGLELDKCAATGRSDDLIYVSPKTGRAVSRDAGKPYHNRLFNLPGFMMGDSTGLTTHDMEAAFSLTIFFLERHIYGPRQIDVPLARSSFVQEVQKAMIVGATNG